jgi:cystathionine beta-lyase/cystathionine gamma-synthase
MVDFAGRGHTAVAVRKKSRKCSKIGSISQGTSQCHMNNVQLFTLAVSLGGVESLIEHPASMTHVSVPKHERERACVLDELIRMSVGCEDFEDLRKDLDQALNEIPQLVYEETEQACFE